MNDPNLYLVDFIFGYYTTGTLNDWFTGDLIDKRGKRKHIIIFTVNPDHIDILYHAKPLSEFRLIIKDVENEKELTAILEEIV